MNDEVKILLLDSNSLINRAFYALPMLTNGKGVFTNAVYGFISMLQKIIRDENPTHICAVFDCHAKTFRHERYEKYKGTRKPMPEELVSQVPLLQELLRKMGIKILFKEGFEADDIIGTLAKRFEEKTIIVSGDRDCLQLVDEATRLYLTRRGVSDIVDCDLGVLAKAGFTPRQIIDLKGLAGDASDNIPGARGVGEKTAEKLLAEYGDIDGIFENIGEIKGKLRDALLADRDIIYLSKELASIKTDVDIPCALKDIVFDYPLPDEALSMMRELDFRGLADRFEFKNTDTPPTEEREDKSEQIEVGDIETLRKILSAAEVKNFSMRLKPRTEIYLDGKTLILDFSRDLFGAGLEDESAFACLKPYFESGNIEKVFFDVKQIMHLLARYGIILSPPYEDVALKEYLADPGRGGRGGSGMFEYSETAQTKDARGLFRLNGKLDGDLEKYRLSTLYRNMELPLIKCLYEMERAGFRIDTNVLNELDAQYTVEIKKSEREIYELAGEEFNVRSNKQLGEILFGKLGLPRSKRNKTGYSVDAEVLEELEHPIADVLLRFRELSKLKSTYIDGMRNVIDDNGRVHTCFKQSLTATGRLSSTDPNLQNIPVRRTLGREIRRMFVPSENCVLVSADYSQIELRLLAHLSEDENLLYAYRNGVDVHALTASKIFRVGLGEVTSDMRSSAKAVNFGIIYGISSFGLAKNAGVGNYRAKQFIEEYFETYPKVKEFMDDNVRIAGENGYLRTLFGRIRKFPGLKSGNRQIRAFNERAAMNMPLQGSASDIIKMAMLKVSKALQKRGLRSKMILQVHDELILDVPFEEETEVRALLKDCMENVAELKIPLEVNVSGGKNWYEVK